MASDTTSATIGNTPTDAVSGDFTQERGETEEEQPSTSATGGDVQQPTQQEGGGGGGEEGEGAAGGGVVEVTVDSQQAAEAGKSFMNLALRFFFSEVLIIQASSCHFIDTQRKMSI